MTHEIIPRRRKTINIPPTKGQARLVVAHPTIIITRRRLKNETRSLVKVYHQKLGSFKIASFMITCISIAKTPTIVNTFVNEFTATISIRLNGVEISSQLQEDIFFFFSRKDSIFFIFLL